MSNIFDFYDRAYVDQLERAYEQAATERKFDTLPDGQYRCVVTKAVPIRPKKNPMEPALLLEFEIIDGSMKGVVTSKYYPMRDENSLNRLKAEIEAMQIDIKGSFRNLGDDDFVEMAFVGVVVDMDVKNTTRKGIAYCNKNILQLVGKYENDVPEEFKNEYEDDENDPF